MSAAWLLASEPPADDVTVVAVADDWTRCDWFFAYYEDGKWFDRSDGGEIIPTHWTPLLGCPSDTPA